LSARQELPQDDIAIWQRIVRIMAILNQKGRPETRKAVHEGKRHLGAVLCDGGDGDPDWGKDAGGEPRPALSEKRLGRFLALPAGERGAALERLARMVAGTRNPDRGINCVEIARLLLQTDARVSLQNLARDYYARLDRAAYRSKDEGTA
jgi:CRISPR system Cascade subunit CasB